MHKAKRIWSRKMLFHEKDLWKALTVNLSRSSFQFLCTEYCVFVGLFYWNKFKLTYSIVGSFGLTLVERTETHLIKTRTTITKDLVFHLHSDYNDRFLSFLQHDKHTHQLHNFEHDKQQCIHLDHHNHK